MIKLQITLFHNEGRYKPLSTLIEIPNFTEYLNNKKEYQLKAVTNIAAKKYLTIQELKQQGFTKLKAREYTTEQLTRDAQKNKMKKMYEAFKKKQQQENS